MILNGKTENRFSLEVLLPPQLKIAEDKDKFNYNKKGC